MALSNVMGNVPFLGGYLASQQQRAQEEGMDMQRQAQAMSLADLLQKRQEQQKLRGIMQASGGDPEKAIPMLIQGGYTEQAGRLADVLKMQTAAKEQQEKREFFSPANQAKYATPGQAAGPMPDPQEIAQSEDQGTPMVLQRPAVAPGFDLSRMVTDAASRGYVPPETLLNHQLQREQARDKLRQDIFMKEREIQKDIQLARERGANQVQLREMQVAGQKAVAEMARSLRQEPAPITTTAPDGTVQLWNRDGTLRANLGRVGAQSGTYQKGIQEKNKAVVNIDEAIRELEKATADGGLIDKSTGSGAGALADAVAGFFGSATEGAVAVGEVAPIYDLVLKMVPRFEGPQSDKDTQLYKEASGQLANPSVPNKIKKSAGKVILRLMKQRRGQFISKDAVGTEADTQNSSGWSDL